MNMRLLDLFSHDRNKKTQTAAPKCAHCGYVQERLHALYCTRCRAEIPGGVGCSGCGRCQKR